MGLLNFVKNIGHGKPDPKAIEEKIKNDLGSQIIELNVEMDGDQVVLSGLCQDNAAKEKAALIAGNTSGISAVNYFQLKVKPSDTTEEKVVNTDDTIVNDTEETSDGTQFYTIVSGDTLSNIAKEFYGDAGKYQFLFEANREVIKDPNKIYVGQTIRIPKVE